MGLIFNLIYSIGAILIALTIMFFIILISIVEMEYFGYHDLGYWIMLNTKEVMIFIIGVMTGGYLLCKKVK